MIRIRSQRRGALMLFALFSASCGRGDVVQHEPVARLGATLLATTPWATATNKQLPARMTFAALETPADLFKAVLRADEAARLAQLAFLAAPRSAAPSSLTSELSACFAAEARLDQARDAAWSAYRPTRVTLAAQQPLRLALFDLHSEVRRWVGPTLHTTVPGLVADRGCAGDIVAQRMTDAYALAVANVLPTRTPAGADAGVAALFPWALQVGCLSAKQLTQLERGLTWGHREVSSRLRAHGLAGLEPTFTRLVAPLMLVVFDARKHAGARSQAYQWFAAQGDSLKQSVAAAGWATGHVALWNRRSGRLLGLPLCPLANSVPTTAAQGCIDLVTFIESLRDPRALGLGDCALASMVTGGTQLLAGDPRYVCAVTSCEAPKNTSSPNGKGALPTSPLKPSATLTDLEKLDAGHLGLTRGGANSSPWSNDVASAVRATWPGLDPAAQGAMHGVCRATGQDMQGVDGTFDSCFAMMLDGQRSPFDTYESCVADAAGGGDPPMFGDPFAGVPHGPRCGLADGEPADGEDSEDPADGVPHTTTSDTAASNPDAGDSGSDSSFLDNLWNGIKGLFGGGSSDSSEGTEPTPEPAPVEPEPEAAPADPAADSAPPAEPDTSAVMKDALGRKLLDAWMDGKITDQEFGDLQGKSLAEQSKALRQKGLNDCVDPTACSGSCTGVEQQIRMNACKQALLDDLIQRSGMPGKGVPEERPLGPVINPDPASAGDLMNLEIGSCLSANGPERPPAHCGLVLCADQSTGVADGGGCRCGPNATALRIPLSDLCSTVRCTDGQLPGPDCSCSLPMDSFDPTNPRPLPTSR